MEEQEAQMSLDQAVATLVNDLPAPVREFVTGPDRDRIALELSQKYRLHADQAAGFQHAYLFLLLGITAPDEFMQSLRDENIPETDAVGLANDVNEMVFKPLREKERTATSVPEAPVPAAKIAPAHLPSASTPPLVPPMQLVTAQPPPASVVPPPPLPTTTPSPAQPPQSVLDPDSAIPPPHHDEGPSVRTMASDMQAVREHRAPEPLPYHPSVPIPPPPTPIAPSATAPIASTPARTAPPPTNLPGAPIVKEYAVDPYRETIE
ncbi:MAG: hypothetical protein ACM3TU_00905 [Bacillota bacterium]